MDGEFEVVINDGRHTTEPVTFKVKILLPTLHLSKSIGFQVFPMLGKAITSLHLLTWCSDTDKNIFYIIKTPPKYGLLTMVDSDLQIPVSNFSQADVNASRIWYQHKTNIVDADTSNDSFWFDVVASYATPILNEVCDSDYYFFVTFRIERKKPFGREFFLTVRIFQSLFKFYIRKFQNLWYQVTE